MKYAIKEGNYAKMGTMVTLAGTIFTFEGEKEAECAVLLYRIRTGEVVRIEVPREYCVGALRSVLVEKLDIRQYQYNYEINGRELVDPYADRIEGRKNWFDLSRCRQGCRVRGGFAGAEYDWEGDHTPEISQEDMVMYKLHVRGFTMDGGARGRMRGTFAAVKEKIPYLRSLGITTVELMPAYEFEEMVFLSAAKPSDYTEWKQKKEQGEDAAPQEQERVEAEKVNFWGYVPGNYFAPKAAYAFSKDEVTELRDLIKALHRNSMECVMEMYFDEKMNQNMILDVLRFWVMQYHVDGFHLIGSALPIRAMTQDLVLRRTKLFYTGFGQELIEKRNENSHLYVYNDEYSYPLRRLLNHIDANLFEFVNQQKKQGRGCAYINYAAINNGFTLADVFMYSEKHNLENGENNMDGADWNFSSNYGVEGPTRRKYIQHLRRRQMRNAMAMVALAQGVPLIASGDEFCNSQGGNNNAYCQDNKVGWVNWKDAAKNAAFTEYIRKLFAFRREHRILRMPQPMHMKDFCGMGYPDLSYHGDNAWVAGFEPSRQAVGMMYCGERDKDSGRRDDFIYIAYNFHNGKKFLALPRIGKEKNWYLVMDTTKEEPFLEKEDRLEKQDLLEIGGLSVRILIGK